MKRYPLDPLLALGWSLNRLRTIAPCNGTEYRRRRTEGITEQTADRIATYLGLSPYELWPALRDDQIADHERLVRERRNRAMRKWRAKPAGKQATLRQNTRYYQETRDYQLRRYQERYWSDPERHRADRRERYARQKAG